MVKFFVPNAKSPEQTESVYESIAKFNDAPINSKRICAIAWKHNGMQFSCEVGSPLPTYYRTKNEPVLAILDCGSLYKICTQNRGGHRGEAVFASKGVSTTTTYFE